LRRENTKHSQKHKNNFYIFVTVDDIRTCSCGPVRGFMDPLLITQGASAGVPNDHLAAFIGINFDGSILFASATLGLPNDPTEGGEMILGGCFTAPAD
jgi:hypothetical protein